MLRLTQVVDENIIVGLQERLTDLLGMSIVFEESTNGDMRTIGRRGGVSKSCTDFIDIKGHGQRQCIDKDTDAAWRAIGSLSLAARGRRVVEFYECNGEMRNFVIPISIGGEVLGCVYAGQFLVDKQKDGDALPAMLARMESEFGVPPARAITFATPPTEDQIDQIATNNRIPSSQRDAFASAYRLNLDKEKLKSLKELMAAVELLDEIAATISALGNAYYLNSLFLRVRSVIPSALDIRLGSEVAQLEELVHGVKPEGMRGFSERVQEINRLAFRILDSVRLYEEEYVGNLLRPYEANLIESEPFDKLKAAYALAQARYMYSDFQVLLADARRAFAGTNRIEPHENAHSSLEERLEALAGEAEKGNLSADEVWAIRLEIDKAAEALREAQGGARDDQEPRERTIDDIEHLLTFLTTESYGIQAIRTAAIEERVLRHLDDFASAARENLELRFDVVYLNIGGISPSTRESRTAQRAWSLKCDGHGPVSHATRGMVESEVEGEDVLSQARGAVAALLGAKPAEIALTANTTHGIELALAALDPHTPDPESPQREILLTEQEHDTVKYCCQVAAAKRGFKLRFLDIGALEDEEIPPAFGEAVNEATAAVVLSHVTYATGRELPIRKISRAVRAQAKRSGSEPVIIVDGAQAVGHVPVRIRDLDCDFYAADGHKWLMAPTGTGFLYVRTQFLESNLCVPLYKNLMVAPEFRPTKEDGSRYEPATVNLEPVVGLTCAVKRLLAVGNDGYREALAAISVAAESFKKLLEEELADYDADVLWSRNGIVVVRFRQCSEVDRHESLQCQLEEQYGVVSRLIFDPLGLRFCVHYTTSSEELRIAARSLRRLLEFGFTDMVGARKRTSSKTGGGSTGESLESLRKGVLERIERNCSEYSREVHAQYDRALVEVGDEPALREAAQQRLSRMQDSIVAIQSELEKEATTAESESDLAAIEEAILARLRAGVKKGQTS